MLAIKKHLESIQNLVFPNFKWVSDKKQYDKMEHWQEPSAIYDGTQKLVGDCDDYALHVRKLINELNIPCRLVFCTTEEGEAHLVTEAEGWVLDNRFREVKSNTYLKEKGYTFLKISSYNLDDDWEIIDNDQAST